MIRPVTALCFVVLLALAAGRTEAAEMAFYMKNGAGRAVAVELHGNAGHVWPGDGKVFMLDTAEKKSVPVACEAGERICYGAWLVGDDRTAWGVGPDNKEDCENCCTICVAKSTYTIDLQR